MTGREIAGTFPNWEMVVPKNFEFFAEINAKQFGEASTRVGVMAEDSHRRIEFVFYPDRVLLKSESPETGSFSEEIGCTFQTINKETNAVNLNEREVAPGWKIAFNTRYLMNFSRFIVQNVTSNESSGNSRAVKGRPK